MIKRSSSRQDRRFLMSLPTARNRPEYFASLTPFPSCHIEYLWNTRSIFSDLVIGSLTRDRRLGGHDPLNFFGRKPSLHHLAFQLDISPVTCEFANLRGNSADHAGDAADQNDKYHHVEWRLNFYDRA